MLLTQFQMGKSAEIAYFVLVSLMLGVDIVLAFRAWVSAVTS